jgi:hypothetical protein
MVAGSRMSILETFTSNLDLFNVVDTQTTFALSIFFKLATVQHTLFQISDTHSIEACRSTHCKQWVRDLELYLCMSARRLYVRVYVTSAMETVKLQIWTPNWMPLYKGYVRMRLVSNIRWTYWYMRYSLHFSCTPDYRCTVERTYW